MAERQIEQGAEVVERYRVSSERAAGFPMDQGIGQITFRQASRGGQGNQLAGRVAGVIRHPEISRCGGQYFVAMVQIMSRPFMNVLGVYIRKVCF